MKQYKLVACDLDGTLLNDALTVSSENKLAIKALKKMGVHFVPITGRTLCEMQDVVNMPDIRYIVYSNGAAILDKETRQQVCLGMSKDLSKFVMDTLSTYDSYCVVHHNGKTYAEPLGNDEIENYSICTAVCKLIKQYASIEKDFEETVYLMDKVESFCIFFRSNDEKEQCKRALTEDGRLFAVDSWENCIEIFCADTGKDKALKLLAKQLGISMEDIISIGDSGNDIEMTKIAGLGLSASNGCNELQTIADRVICSNNEHVVSYVLSNYFLKQ